MADQQQDKARHFLNRGLATKRQHPIPRLVQLTHVLLVQLQFHFRVLFDETLNHMFVSTIAVLLHFPVTNNFVLLRLFVD